MRVVLDANVFVSAVLSRAGAPARLLERWRAGDFDLVVSEALLAEVERILKSDKVVSRVAAGAPTELLSLLREEAELVQDPTEPPPVRSDDPGDDYLIAIASAEHAALVSGDDHLLRLAGRAPVYTPRDFLDRL